MQFPGYTPPQLGPNPYQIAGQAAMQLGQQVGEFGENRDKMRMAYADMVEKRRQKILDDERAAEALRLQQEQAGREREKYEREADALKRAGEVRGRVSQAIQSGQPFTRQQEADLYLSSGLDLPQRWATPEPTKPERFNLEGGRYEQMPDGTLKTIIAPKPDEGPTPQIIQTNEGVFGIDKDTWKAIPVTGAEGPLGGKKALSPEDKRQARRTTDQSFQSLGRVRRDLDRIESLPLWKVAGVYGANLPDLKGEEAASARSEIEGLKSKLATIALQNMREASKTGGAVGQVTDREWGFLAQSIANLDTERMTVGALKAQLDEARRFIQESEMIQMRAYKDAFGEEYQNPFENIPDSIRRPSENPKADALRGKYGY